MGPSNSTAPRARMDDARPLPIPGVSTVDNPDPDARSYRDRQTDRQTGTSSYKSQVQCHTSIVPRSRIVLDGIQTIQQLNSVIPVHQTDSLPVRSSKTASQSTTRMKFNDGHLRLQRPVLNSLLRLPFVVGAVVVGAPVTDLDAVWFPPPPSPPA